MTSVPLCAGDSSATEEFLCASTPLLVQSSGASAGSLTCWANVVSDPFWRPIIPMSIEMTYMSERDGAARGEHACPAPAGAAAAWAVPGPVSRALLLGACSDILG